MEHFFYFPSFISAKEKVYWTENRRNKHSNERPKVQTGLAILREHLDSLHSCKPSGSDKLHPSLILEELGNKTSYCLLSQKNLETGAGIDDKLLKQVIKHDPEHRERNGGIQTCLGVKKGQVMI